MENSLQLTSSKLQKCKRRRRRRMKEEVYMGDRISELPDGILEIILSRLTMREAVCTSVLSRRWKDLWAYTTGSLDFDFGSKVRSLINNHQLFKLLEPERGRYISRVNKNLNAHKGSTIEAFRVDFDLNSSHKSDIDSWIKFSLRKRVRRLELHLKPANLFQVRVNWKEFYPFPSLAGQPNINCLTSLNLYYVNVTGKVLEYLLSNCPCLEFLHITFSVVLVGVRVVAPCPKLKHLEIADCDPLEYFDIYSAPNLRSVSYSGPKETRLCLRNVPNLVDVSLGGSYCVGMGDRFRQLPIALSQIEKLKLCLDTLSCFDERCPEFHEFPELRNVKQLELRSDTYEDESLLSCVSVMDACPNLYRFSMQFDWVGGPKEREVLQRENCVMHKCLKVVELVWFRGRATDVELATYILSTSPFLEKIIIDTRSNYSCGSYFVEEENVSAKEWARHLAEQLSPAAELVIL